MATTIQFTIREPYKHIEILTVVDGLNHRRVLSPGDDISGEPQALKEVVASTWTQEVLDAFRMFLDSQKKAPMAHHIKAERQRRIYQIADPDKQNYYQRLMISWLEQGRENWTQEQIDQAEVIRAGNAAIDVIVAKANELENMDIIPDDYADDKWWS